MSSFKDEVHVRDAGVARLIDTRGGVTELQRREWESFAERPVVEVNGWVKAILRERGKIVGIREGHNIWTNTGREFIAMLMSLQIGSTKFRADNIAFIGVGIGTQVEDPGILQVLTPSAYIAGQFLAALDVPATFPLTPSRTTVRYHRTFIETELTLTGGSRVDVTELGLYTDGSPASSFTPGTRDRTLANATQQAPVAYKSFDALGKTDTMQLDLSWDIRL
jgi:hypothetical protein